MADVLQKIRMLKMFRLNPDKFLPIVDHAWKVFPDKDMGTEWYPYAPLNEYNSKKKMEESHE